MEGLQQTQGVSSPQAASRGERQLVTPEEALERGLTCKTEPPPSRKCEFCGKELPPEGFVAGKEVLFWSHYHRRCDCPEAKAKREQQRREEKMAEEAEAERRRKEAMQARVKKLLGDSGIKRRFQNRTFENFIRDTPGRKRSYKIAKEYADNFALHARRGDGLYIEGTNGTGKTHLAAAIALQLIGAGTPVICKTAADLLLDIKKSYDTEGLQEKAVLDVYKTVDLLIIDDLGKEQCSDWSMSTLYSILNDRYEDMRPTIITTNYNNEALVKAMTPKGADNSKIVAIVSRLRETNAVLTMAWEDARGKEADKR